MSEVAEQAIDFVGIELKLWPLENFGVFLKNRGERNSLTCPAIARATSEAGRLSA
jgi:hypothetical protein